MHLLPPLRRRLVDVPLGIDLFYWVEDPDFDLDFHVRETAVPPSGDDRRLAETVARISPGRSTARGPCGSCTSCAACRTAASGC